MEIDITNFFNNANPFDFSASCAERGPNAGPDTWRNALQEAADTPLLATNDALDEARDYFRATGGWTREELAIKSVNEINALLIQWISGNLREIKDLAMDDNGEIDWTEVERLVNEGTITGDIYPNDDKIYFSMSH
jgi:hypothetical protein